MFMFPEGGCAGLEKIFPFIPASKKTHFAAFLINPRLFTAQHATFWQPTRSRESWVVIYAPVPTVNLYALFGRFIHNT